MARTDIQRRILQYLDLTAPKVVAGKKKGPNVQVVIF